MRVKRIVIWTLVALALAGCRKESQPDSGRNHPPVMKNVRLETTNLPVVFINTLDHEIIKDEYVQARMKIIDNPDGVNYGDTLAHPDQAVDYEGYIAIKYRGHNSLSPKQPYNIKLTTDSGSKRKAPLLGMGNDNSWAMLAPYTDRSFIRNTLTLTLARGYTEFVPQTRFCELILDGTYYGVHSLMEKVRRGDDRLKIKKPGDSGDALTGGYIVCIDRNDEPFVHASKYLPVDTSGKPFNGKTVWMQYTDPDCDDITDAQRAYIDGFFDAFEDALASDNYKDPEKGYRKYIDVTSFIDYQLATEISDNIDGYRLSTYLYKYRDSVDPRFKMSLWDFDMAWGLSDKYIPGVRTDNWVYQNNDSDLLRIKMPFWFGRLMTDPAYVAELKARYAEYRQGRYADVPAVIDSLSTLLTVGGAADRDRQAWRLLGFAESGKAYTNEIASLRDFATARIAWLDSQLGQ